MATSEAARRGSSLRHPGASCCLPSFCCCQNDPGYGYGLVPRLNEFRFGHVDRPAVDRALAQLERDGLRRASSESPKAGQARRVYQVTPLGQQVLRMWMSVVKDEHDYLGNVLRRYQATGTTDSMLAEVEGGWAAALGVGWSPVSSTSMARRAFATVESGFEYLNPELEDCAADGLTGSGDDDGWADDELRNEPVSPRRRSFSGSHRSEVFGGTVKFRRHRRQGIDRGNSGRRSLSNRHRYLRPPRSRHIRTEIRQQDL